MKDASHRDDKPSTPQPAQCDSAGALHSYDTDRLDYPTSTPLTLINPDAIRVQSTSTSVIKHYQARMSKAVWRPAPGRKLGFLVTHDEALLGLIFLASPVIRLTVRDTHLLLTGGCDEEIDRAVDEDCNIRYGIVTRHYMDMSVCVATQPIGWHWNIGKLLALIAPTLGDYVEKRHSRKGRVPFPQFFIDDPDEFRGITTTSVWGKSFQYNRIYKFLGYTKGHGHEHISEEEYKRMVTYLREHSALPGTRFGQGANARMRRIAAYRKLTGDKTITLFHGKKRGVYYHSAVDPSQRPDVIMKWFNRWGLPRYERTKDETPPYASGLEGRTA
jgi:hypothetical protein